MTKLMFFYSVQFLLFIFFLSPTVTFAQQRTTVSGAIIQDTTWYAGQEYVIAGEVLVFVGATLTIQPGATVLLGVDSFLIANGGTIIANGTSGNQIVFDGLLSGTEREHFSAIYATSGGSLTVSHATITNAFACLRVDDEATLTVTNVLFTNCEYGILAAGGTLSVTHSTFVNAQPLIEFRTQFTHSNNHFPDDDRDGWAIGGSVAFQDIVIEGADGSYTLTPLFSITEGNSMTIREGVTIRLADTGWGPEIQGALFFNGTKDKPILVRGTGGCPLHAPAFRLYDHGTVSIKHTSFVDLCGGFSGQAQQQVTIGEGVVFPSTSENFFKGITVKKESVVVVEVPQTPVTPPVVTPPATVSKIPIIIIPGITGTALFKAYGNFRQLWPAVTDIVFSLFDSQLRELALLANGTENSLYPTILGDIIRSVTIFGIQSDTFEGLITELKNQGYSEGVDLFVFPYDWRMDITKTVQLLQQYIVTVKNKTNAQKVSLVAHSMGGLLVKKYSSMSGNAAIDRIIFIGTPHLGAPMAAKALLYGDDLGLRFGISLLNQKTIQYISQHMYAMYQLLPSARYVATLGQYLHASVAIFTHADVGATLHNPIDTMQFDDVPVFNITSCGTATLSEIIQKTASALPTFGLFDAFNVRLLYTMQGDGSVPLGSAAGIEGSSVVHYYNNTARHSAMPSDANIKKAIVSLLLGQVPIQNNTFSQSRAVCDQKGIEIETVGMKVDVTDQHNAYTGIDEHGAIVYGDPAIAYSAIEESRQTFIALPATNQYTITYRLLPGAVHVIAVDTISATGTISTQQYNTIPPLPNNAVLQSCVRDGVVSPTISLDQDGDGMFEKTIEDVVPEVPLPEKEIILEKPATKEDAVLVIKNTNNNADTFGSMPKKRVVSVIAETKSTSDSVVLLKNEVSVQDTTVPLHTKQEQQEQFYIQGIAYPKPVVFWWETVWNHIFTKVHSLIGIFTHTVAILLQ